MGVSLLALKKTLTKNHPHIMCGNDRSALTKKTKLTCLKYTFRILDLA